jgi:GH15 family glucan-1,4-alpha-glucosidase
LNHGKIQLPIQEDETALVLDSLWKHYKRNKNEDVKKLYGTLIKNAGNFLVKFRDEKTKLPKESYDLWEEKIGVHTFTCATVYAGLEAAKNFADIFGEKQEKEKYEKAAQEVKDAILKYLYDKDRGIFIKRIYSDEEGNWLRDNTIDVSTVYGLFEYKILPANDERIVRTMEKTLEKLWCITPTGGVYRYENDKYYRTGKDASENPWFISTFWLAEWYIENAKKMGDLKLAEDLLKWATNRALPSGALSEQLNPNTAEPLSVSPLTWSHAGFIIAVIKYIGKCKILKGIKD